VLFFILFYFLEIMHLSTFPAHTQCFESCLIRRCLQEPVRTPSFILFISLSSLGFGAKVSWHLCVFVSVCVYDWADVLTHFEVENPDIKRGERLLIQDVKGRKDIRGQS